MQVLVRQTQFKFLAIRELMVHKCQDTQDLSQSTASPGVQIRAVLKGVPTSTMHTTESLIVLGCRWALVLFPRRIPLLQPVVREMVRRPMIKGNVFTLTMRITVSLEERGNQYHQRKDIGRI